jgi:hypothetical protein
MKKTLLLFLAIIFVACDTFPTNPPKTPPAQPLVSIEHASTDYVPVDPPGEGIVATMVNILTFEVKAENFQPKALEFYIKAGFEGPPDAQDHMILFRTDEVAYNPEETGYNFVTLDQIQSGTVYTLIRPKYPTNEYSPFQGDQGKILTVKIVEVWAISDIGEKYSVDFQDSL